MFLYSEMFKYVNFFLISYKTYDKKGGINYVEK